MSMNNKTRCLLAGLMCLALWSAHVFAQGGLWEKYMAAGQAAYQQGNNAEAEKQFSAALIEAEQFGPEDIRFGGTLNALGFIYHTQGKYAEAEPLLKRALAIAEKARGPDHPDVATSLNNLAALYHAQGRYAEAEPLYKRSLAVLEKVLRPEHPRLAGALENYATLLRETGRSAEAEELEVRANAIRTKSE